MKTPEGIKAGLRCHAVQWYAGECPDHEPGCKGCPYDNDYHDPDEVMADALELIEELEKKVPQWISVEDQPEPPEDDVYYCYGYWIGSGRKQAETAEYLCGEWKIENNFVLTHWMPMPMPPRGDRDDSVQTLR